MAAVEKCENDIFDTATETADGSLMAYGSQPWGTWLIKTRARNAIVLPYQSNSQIQDTTHLLFA